MSRDQDMDGFIPRAELRMIFAALPERLTEEEIEEMLEAADEDGKGKGRGHLNWTFGLLSGS